MYIPLFNKSYYTLLSSLLKVDDIVEFAKKNNLPSIALTDTNMFATMEFIKKCEAEGIKPIVGLNVLLNDYNIILLAKDYLGYKSLIKLATIQSEKIITAEELETYKRSLICILMYNYKSKYDELKQIYEDIYLGYSNISEEKELLLITKSVVFVNESLYLDQNDSKYLETLYRIRDGKTVLDNTTYQINNHALNIFNVSELSNEIGLKNTIDIADKCHIEFSKHDNLLPVYECEDPKKYLFDLARLGLAKRLDKEIPDNYKERLSYELKIINDMGFSNYFLVVYDFIKYAKKNNILVGPGRGSAAGSLVAYSLGITDVDPLEYNLLFERFLNPERKTMPDIDTDFPDDKRDQVVDYVKEKYGLKRVSGIITFGTMAAKQVIRDVSRTLNIPLYKVDSLCKFIPNFSKEKLKDIYKNNEQFRVRIESDTALSNMFSIAIQLEGLPRHTSSHAAGIVMSRVDLDEVIPLTKVDNLYLTGYSMEYLEELGLLKMDFLALRNLTIIANIIESVKQDLNIDIDFNKIPLNDKETLKYFETANTSGIFQFESSGMRNFLRKLKPNTFEDIFAAIALFRPGAALNIDSYIKRKHKEEKIEYLDKSLEEITKSTYGFLIYQEQIMQVANIYAGYTLGEADILRRAMSKKKVDLLKSEEEKFIEKSVSKGHSKEQAKKIFNLILNFAGYGFNKSHSVAYSIIAYKMAYLKCHYKTYFFASLLTNVIGSEAKTNEYIMEAKANGIEIEKPTISASSDEYIVVENKIIYPISNIKGVGVVIADAIKNAKSNANFTDIYDCFSKLCIAGIGKKTFEILIYADVFKEFGYNRGTLIYNLESLFNYSDLTKDIDPSLIEKPEIEYQNDFSNAYILEKEKEVFGFYLSSHPITFFRTKYLNCIMMNNIDNYFDKDIDVLLLVDKIKVISTKKNEKMAFITGSDETGTKEFTMFPKLFSKNQDIEKGKLLKVRGHVEKRFNEIQVILEKIENIEGE